MSLSTFIRGHHEEIIREFAAFAKTLMPRGEEAMTEIRTGHPDAVLRWQGSGDLCGEWDADRLSQVVSNLVGNAIEHGNGTPITVSGQEQGDLVFLTVHNGGPPIPSELLPSVFEPLAAAPRRVCRTTSALGSSLRSPSSRLTAET
jgi:signal transduction histidine kinase